MKPCDQTPKITEKVLTAELPVASPQDSTFFERLVHYQSVGIPVAIATVIRVVSPTAAKPGAKAIVSADEIVQGWIGGGCAQPAVIKTAKQVIRDGQPRLIRVSPKGQFEPVEDVVDFSSTCLSGGTLEIFVEPLAIQPCLIILGDSPVAECLCGLANQVGFCVTVAGCGESGERFLGASQVLTDFTQLAGTGGYVVVASQGKSDRAALAAALDLNPDYIAFIASKKKAVRLKNELVEKGFDKEVVAKIVSPAGIDIGAVTPEEIALSVLAGVVRARRLGQAPIHTLEQQVIHSECESHAGETQQHNPDCCGTTE